MLYPFAAEPQSDPESETYFGAINRNTNNVSTTTPPPTSAARTSQPTTTTSQMSGSLVTSGNAGSVSGYGDNMNGVGVGATGGVNAISGVSKLKSKLVQPRVQRTGSGVGCGNSVTGVSVASASSGSGLCAMAAGPQSDIVNVTVGSGSGGGGGGGGSAGSGNGTGHNSDSNNSNNHNVHIINNSNHNGDENAGSHENILSNRRNYHHETKCSVRAASDNGNHRNGGGVGNGGGASGGGGGGSDTASTKSTRSTNSSSGSICNGSSCSETETSTSSGQPNLPYPGFPAIALKYLSQDTRPRNWCLLLITNPQFLVNTWFERVSILVILLNCITLGMYQPCVDDQCVTSRCKILQIFDDIIFVFFALEMTIKMMAMGVWGKNTYLADSWNRLDFFIVLAGALEYCLNVENLNLTAIRTIRVLRPLRAINRIPSMRILVMLLLDTLPMLGNVLLLCFFVFFIFGIVGVQLWEGILRQRCVLVLPPQVIAPEGLPDQFRVRVRVNSVSFYYEFSKEQDYICSKPEDSGMHLCNALPPYRQGAMECNESALTKSYNHPTNTSCVNWNQYYTNCTQLGGNPFQGTISFDNIGLAWVAIFLVISLEGWTDIMYYVQDAHSFWDWIYFVLLIVIGSFFMINLCLVVIATQFAETKKREMERMRQERARYTSTSTLASSTNNSEPTTCYAEIVKYIAHVCRRSKRRLLKKLRLYKYQRQQRHEGLIQNPETLALSPSKIKCHHPKCPNRKSTNVPSDQMVTVMVPMNSSGAINLNASLHSINTQINQESQISSPDISEMSFEKNSTKRNINSNNEHKDEKQKTILLKISNVSESEQLINQSTTTGFLSPPFSTRRRSSVMFNEYVILHTPPPIPEPTPDKNACSSEKMTQAGDGSIWQVNLPQSIAPPHSIANTLADCSDLSLNDTMTCQELLAFSVAFSAALPTGQTTLESFYSSLKRADPPIPSPALPLQPDTASNSLGPQNCSYPHEDYSCCYELYQKSIAANMAASASQEKRKTTNKFYITVITVYRMINKVFSFLRRYVQRLVEHKYFQQGILLAILINTLSMGIEYHDQPEELTAIVETSNIAFSAIFAVEMMLKVVAEGPFKYIANGFNVFDGVIVILSVVELTQEFFGMTDGGGSSGLSVLRTFRLLRILKLVRFMPNLRRQLFVMLRTMDNVAVFFSLLILFIFIFSILGMNLFGCKFCEKVGDEMSCDRKNFDSLLWALVTVFQILTQEDWNVVLFNGMEKTTHWAALYFVALMTFGNYVLFNLLVAILVEGFSSERNERREREQRELVKKLREENMADNLDEMLREEIRSASVSTTTSDSYHAIKNKWRSAEELRKEDPKCNIQKQQMRQPNGGNESGHRDSKHSLPKRNSEKDGARGSSEEHSLRKRNSIRSQSIRERRSDPYKMQNTSYYREPPIITTTAPTPQDSPNTTLISGTSFKDFDIESFEIESKESSQSIPTLLRPPSILCTIRGSDERIFYEHSTTGLPLEAKSQLPSSRLSLDDSPSGSRQSITTPTIAKPASTMMSKENLADDATAKSAAKDIPESQSQIQRSSSFKKFSRTYSKRKKKGGTDTDDEVILNNGRDNTHRSSISIAHQNRSGSLQSTNRIQNDTRSSIPQAYMRRPSMSLSGRRGSAMFNNAHIYQNLNRRSSMKNFPSSNHRRMSLIEQAFEKNSYLNVYNLESNLEESGSKFDINNSVKSASIGSVHESEHQIEMQEEYPKFSMLYNRHQLKKFLDHREEYAMYVFSQKNRFRRACSWFVDQKWFDNVILFFIALNCITLAMERPNIPPVSPERFFLATANYVFTVVFTIEMFVKVVAAGMFYGHEAYFTSGWNIMDGSLVIISIIDLLMSVISESSPRIFGILRVFRLLRSLRPLRVINRAPGLKLVVQTLLSSLRPIGNIVLICCTFFIIFGILGVQLFKGTFFYCEGENIKGVRNKQECIDYEGNVWINRKYNFDDLGKALMSLFVLSSRDGWVNIMYTGLDAVGVDQQPIVNYNEWRLLYFIAFILLVGFFVLNMFVGVVVENFHRCREEQEKEEKIRRAAKRALQMEKKRRKMHEPPYYTNYSPTRLFVHNVVTSKYFDLAIAAVIGLNVVTMALEYYMMPVALQYALKIFNYFFTAVFILEAIMKLVALGVKIYMKDKWNQLDVGIVILSIVGIVLEELETNIIPINPTIIRVMRVLRIARVLKLLKMAKGIRALLDTVMQALPQVGNLGLLFFLLFFIFAALGVELFGRLECSDLMPCQGLGEHAHFANFGMAFLTLFRVATGDNWNGIMKDTLRDDCDDAADCVKNCCVSTVIAPIFFVIFVLMAQFVLVNVVVAVLMKHLEESHKQMEDDLEMDTELEREFEREQEFEEEQALCLQLQEEAASVSKRPLAKVSSLPSNFTYNTPVFEKRYLSQRRQTMYYIRESAKDIQSHFLAEEEQKDDSVPSRNIFGNNSDPNINANAEEEKKRRRSSLRPKLTKERSLDERKLGNRMRRGSTRLSCDSLSWKSEKVSNMMRLPETNENDTQAVLDKTFDLSCENVVEEEKDEESEHEEAAVEERKSLPPDAGSMSLFLAVPKLQSARSRSGSCKQLFKQHAMEEDPDIDENSLLLPMASSKARPTQTKDRNCGSDADERLLRVENCETGDNIKKSDSSEILRIITERRRVEIKEPDSKNEEPQNELLDKSQESSTEALQPSDPLQDLNS